MTLPKDRTALSNIMHTLAHYVRALVTRHDRRPLLDPMREE